MTQASFVLLAVLAACFGVVFFSLRDLHAKIDAIVLANQNRNDVEGFQPQTPNTTPNTTPTPTPTHTETHTQTSSCAHSSNDVASKRWMDAEILSWEPRIVYFPHFLSDELCDELITVAEPLVKASHTDVGLREEIRRSYATFLTRQLEIEHPNLKRIKSQISNFTQIPLDHFEALQVQRYRDPTSQQNNNSNKTEYYHPHMDSAEMHRPNRRKATVVMYLADVEEGGETVFPLVSANTTARSRANFGLDYEAAIEFAYTRWEDVCGPNHAQVIKVKPKKGSAVLFYSVDAGGNLDTMTVHGSCSVVRGTKWVSQQWIHESTYIPQWSPAVIAAYHLSTWDTHSKSKNADSVLFDESKNRLHLRTESTIRDTVHLSDEFRACSKPSNFLSGLQQSHALAVSMMLYISECSQGRENVGITIATSSQECCHLRVSVSRSCGIAVFGLGKQSRVQATNRLQPGWSHVVVQVVPKNNPKAAFDPSTWTYEIQLVINGTTTHSNSGTHSVDLSQVTWGEATLCYQKGKDMAVRELIVFQQTRTPAQLEWIETVGRTDIKFGKHHTLFPIPA